MSKLGLDKIIVRRIVATDRPVLRRWLKDPEVRAAIEDETIDLSSMAQALTLFESSDPFHDSGLGLMVEAAGRPIGLIHFVWINWVSRNAEVIVFVGPGELRRSLIAAVVVEKIGHAAFRVLNLHKIYAFVYGANAAALAVFRKLMKEEACLRAYVKSPEGYSDFHFFGLLASEYFAAVEKIKGAA
jgi:RimJ/RimL family protein N-acetyltransferase